MGWISGFYRKDGSYVSGHHRRDGSPTGGTGDGISHERKIRIVAGLIEKGVLKQDLSNTYQQLWDEAWEWITDGKPQEEEFVPPPGGKWISPGIYEVDGKYYAKGIKYTR